MNRYRSTTTVLLSLVWLLQPADQMRAADEIASVVTFDKVLPVLRQRCASCHGRNEPRSNLDLTSLAALKSGSDSGPVAVAGQPDQSLLYLLAAHLEEPIMPPGKQRIPARELQLLHDWIAGGMLERAGSTPSGGVGRDAAQPAAGAFTPLSRRTAVTALAVHPLRNLVAVSGMEQVVLLDAKSGKPVQALPFPEGEVFSLKFSKDGKWLVAGGGLGAESGKVVIFDVASGQRQLETPEEPDSVLAADVSPDGHYLAWGGPWRTIKLYDIVKQQPIATLTGQTDWVLSVCFSPDGLLVAGSDRFGGVRVWRARDGKPFWELKGHTGAVPGLVWSPHSDHLLSWGEDGTARLWDLHSGEAELTWQIDSAGLWAAAWHPSDVIAIGGRSRKVVLLDPKGSRLKELSAADEITELAFTPDGSHLLVADASGEISQYTVASGQKAGDFSLPVSQTVARIEIPWPMRTRARREEPPALVPTASTQDSLQQALREAELAIKTAEESLSKLRATAGLLRQALGEREAAKPAKPAKP